MVRTPVGLQAVEALTRVQSERLRGTDVAAVEHIDPWPPVGTCVDADAIHIHAGADRDGVHDFSGRCKGCIRKHRAERFAEGLADDDPAFFIPSVYPIRSSPACQ
ncbi:hypothetical protein ON010_g1226 [Phytophthora cinnamomi]|nr:hypothetical protein ON010_g1226 [Phytophthora cinnamomi]